MVNQVCNLIKIFIALFGDNALSKIISAKIVWPI